MTTSNASSWESSLGSLVTTAGKDYFNSRFNARSSTAAAPIYASAPVTTSVQSTASGSIMTNPLLIGGAVVAVVLVAYFVLRKK